MLRPGLCSSSYSASPLTSRGDTHCPLARGHVYRSCQVCVLQCLPQLYTVLHLL